MDTIIDHQVAMDEALVPRAKRLRIRRSNFRLLLDIKSKESTLQLVDDVLRICPFFKAFLVTADVPKIYMLEFWATTTVHYHSIRFKIDNKKHIVNLESFRDMLHICLRVHGQSFDEPLFKEEITAFIHFLRNSTGIRTLTDVNINKLYQPWRSFAAIINKCLTGKSSGYDSLRLSQAQILWGLYHQRNVDCAYLMWEDFFIKSNTKIRRRAMRCTIPDSQRLLFITSCQRIRPFRGETVPKPKASVRRTRTSSDTSITPPIAVADPRLTTSQKASGSGIDKRTGSIPGVLDVPTDESEEELLWNSTDDEGADDEGKDGDDDDEDDDGEEGDDDDDDVDQEVVSDDDKDDAEKSGDDEEEGGSDKQESDEETREKESFDPIPQNPKDSEDESNGEEDLGLNVGGEGRIKEEEEDKLYRHVNINQERGLQTTLKVEDSHVTLKPVNPNGIESIFRSTSKLDVQTPNSVAPLPLTAPTMTSSTIVTTITTSQAPNLPTTVPSDIIQNLPSFGLLFRFDDRLRTSYVVAVDLSEMELKKILIKKMEGNKSIQCSDEQRNLYKALVDAYESDKLILDTYGETVTLKRQRDDDADKDEEPSAGPDRGSKRRREGKEPESASALTKTATRSVGRSTQGSRSRQASASHFGLAEEPMQTTSQMEEPSHLEFDTDHAWNKTLPAVHGSIQPWISKLAKQADSRSFFNELMDTPLDFSNFLMIWIRVDTLTPELLVGPTYELMKGSCKSLVELEYHLEEVYKVTTDQLDQVNPEGQQYPHNLLQPLPLLPNNRGRRVIPFEHFINNDLEYLCRGASSRKYTTSITKTKAADYRHIKWIEDLGRKRQQFYGFAVNWKFAHDVYYKRRIIAVIEFKIVEWHSYKYLDRITVRRDDDKLYKFKEGDFKRLRIQDIEYMLLLLVQGKLTNLTVEERFAFNVSLRILTRSIISLTKDETPEILKNFITCIENQMDHKVKTIRCDNGTNFKIKIMNKFCEIKGIRREFSVARTPQQNGVAERKNKTLIEAARTMLADSKFPTTFWAKAVNNASYV
uniref:Putative ribonuclease H-like domain-containing protein n=1 Tax=Tanacetum cinerariifolium TaxID=118510 RepID=A0A6L2LK32_TANCI|nr:putative ribonuclease H-like domain-containing protein [Tanacetum cinerariifolium]